MSTIPPWFKLPKSPHLQPSNSGSDKPVIVVGCGLAGCHTAFELATRGIKVIMLDAGDTIAAGASGNNAGIVKPFVTRSTGATDQFYQYAFNFLLKRFATNKRLCDAAQFTQCGVLQLVERDYPDNESYDACSAQQATQIAGVIIDSPAVFFSRAGWLNPVSLCQALVQHENIKLHLKHIVHSVSLVDDQWSIAVEVATHTGTAKHASTHMECETLILANGTGINKLHPTQSLPIIAARGQTSRFTLAANTVLKTVVTGKRYAIPDDSSVVVGASFTRDNEQTNLLDSEHADNLAGLNTLLPTLKVDAVAHSGFCAIRATTPDRLPMVGPVPDYSIYRKDYARLRDGLAQHHFPAASYKHGLYVIGGFGSRGIVSSPYCASLLVDYLCNSTGYGQSTTEQNLRTLSQWSPMLHAGRFLVRKLKRARSPVG